MAEVLHYSDLFTFGNSESASGLRTQASTF